MQFFGHLLYFLEAPQNVALVKVNQYDHSELADEYSWFLDLISSSNILCHLGGKKKYFFKYSRTAGEYPIA